MVFMYAIKIISIYNQQDFSKNIPLKKTIQVNLILSLFFLILKQSYQQIKGSPQNDEQNEGLFDFIDIFFTMIQKILKKKNYFHRTQ